MVLHSPFKAQEARGGEFWVLLGGVSCGVFFCRIPCPVTSGVEPGVLPGVHLSDTEMPVTGAMVASQR